MVICRTWYMPPELFTYLVPSGSISLCSVIITVAATSIVPLWYIALFSISLTTLKLYSRLRKWSWMNDRYINRFKKNESEQLFECLTSVVTGTRRGARECRAPFFFGQDSVFRRECSIYVPSGPHVSINHEMRRRAKFSCRGVAINACVHRNYYQAQPLRHLLYGLHSSTISRAAKNAMHCVR